MAIVNFHVSNLDSIQQLADRFINDAAFREQMRQDPEGAAEREGYQFDAEDKQSKKRRGWDSNPRDDLTPPTRFPIALLRPTRTPLRKRRRGVYQKANL